MSASFKKLLHDNFFPSQQCKNPDMVILSDFDPFMGSQQFLCTHKSQILFTNVQQNHNQQFLSKLDHYFSISFILARPSGSNQATVHDHHYDAPSTPPYPLDPPIPHHYAYQMNENNVPISFFIICSKTAVYFTKIDKFQNLQKLVIHCGQTFKTICMGTFKYRFQTSYVE